MCEVGSSFSVYGKIFRYAQQVIRKSPSTPPKMRTDCFEPDFCFLEINFFLPPCGGEYLLYTLC